MIFALIALLALATFAFGVLQFVNGRDGPPPAARPRSETNAPVPTPQPVKPAGHDRASASEQVIFKLLKASEDAAAC
jgi:hypothetical protein